MASTSRPIGPFVGRFRIEERIGAGGMGEVYRAYDPLLRRAVALKRLLSRDLDDAEQRRRLLTEARAVSKLRHPSVVAVYDVVEHNGEAFLVEEYEPGKPLRQRLAQPFALDELLRILEDCGDALGAAAELGIVHCDIKPENILISQDGRPRILDFGLARRRPSATPAGGSEDSTSEMPGPAGGTPAYLAPEVLSGQQPDTRSDIFALGIVAYEMLTLRHPFRKGTPEATVGSILHEEPPPPSHLRPGLSSEIDRLIARMLAKEPERRISSPSDLIREVRHVRSALASGQSFPRRLGRRLAIAARARPLLSWAIAGAVLFGGGALIWQRHQHPKAPSAGPLYLSVAPFTTSVVGDTATASFAAGLTEVLRSSLSRYRIVDVLDEHPEVQAPLQLRGSLERSRDLLRISYRLLDRETGRTLDGDLIEGDAGRFFELQDRLCDRIAKGLVRVLPDVPPIERQPPAERPTLDVTAYDLYLQGRGTLRQAKEERSAAVATTMFERALTLDPSFGLAEAGLAEAYVKRFRFSNDATWLDKAEESGLRALELTPAAADVQAAIGGVLLAAGKPDRSEAAFRRALELDPEHDAAPLGLARALQARGAVSEAEAAYLQNLRRHPESWLAHNALGSFFVAQGRWEEARAAFQRVVALAPDYAGGYSNLGVACQQLGLASEAIAAYESSMRIRPTAPALSNLGLLMRAEGRLSEAADAFQRALAIDDRDYRVWANLASVCFRLPDRATEADSILGQAILRAEERLGRAPDDPYVLADLAQYYAHLDQEVVARNLIEHALATHPMDVDVLAGAAAVFEQAGRHAEARAYLLDALRHGLPIETLKSEPVYNTLLADSNVASAVRALSSSNATH